MSLARPIRWKMIFVYAYIHLLGHTKVSGGLTSRKSLLFIAGILPTSVLSVSRGVHGALPRCQETAAKENIPQRRQDRKKFAGDDLGPWQISLLFSRHASSCLAVSLKRIVMVPRCGDALRRACPDEASGPQEKPCAVKLIKCRNAGVLAESARC